jgi:glycosyltransferase involved in cell wall biosynthesis
LNWEKYRKKVSLPDQIELPSIPQVPEGVDRPFWSVMIPTYNRTKYLEETLRSVLEQDLGPEEMQIEVIDNCSIEGESEAIVKEVGKGRVSFYRQPYNVGMAGNWNTCINRARGHWVHILHDDDTVLPGFYSHLQAALEKEPPVGAAFCRYLSMDSESNWLSISAIEMRTSGVISDLIERLGPGFIQCPAVVVKRTTYEKLGGFSCELKYMPDLEMWMRIALHNSFWYESLPLACYRVRSAESETMAIIKNNTAITDGYRLIGILQSYISPEIADKILKQTKKNIRILSIHAIRYNINVSDMYTARLQMQELLRCDISWRAIKGIIGSFKGKAIIKLPEMIREIMYPK